MKGWGIRRSEPALVYYIPNHSNPHRPHQKGYTTKAGLHDHEPDEVKVSPESEPLQSGISWRRTIQAEERIVKMKKIQRIATTFLAFLMICAVTLVYAESSTDLGTVAELVEMQPYSERWIDDRHFVYGLELLDFDLTEYLAAYAPHLLSKRELISHWTGYYSISPKIILTIMDLQSQSVSSSNVPTLVDRPFVELAMSTGFENQLKEVLSKLYSDYYAFLMAKKSSDNKPLSDEINAATYALLNLFRPTYSKKEFSILEPALRFEFLNRYYLLFPDKSGDLDRGGNIEATPPASLLQLPWKTGEAWYFNGVHTWTGNDPGIMSSIDFVENWNLGWGDDTSTDYVVAAHEGTVTVFSSCFVRVTGSDGWATNYYHLDNLQVSNGDAVASNQSLGTYANTQAQALCSGGSSTGPHVHFALLSNGSYSSLSGVNLSGYAIHPGRHSYDSDHSYMWIEKASTRYYAYIDVLVSATVSLEVPDISLSVTPSPSTLPEPGGDVAFGIAVSNIGVIDVTLTELSDDAVGDINGKGNCSVPQGLAASVGTYNCSYTLPASGNAGDELPLTVTATANGPQNSDTEEFETSVTITDVLPTAALNAASDPADLPEPGGMSEITVNIENTGTAEPILMTSLTDSAIGDLKFFCEIPFSIDPGATYRCSYSAVFTGNANDTPSRNINATVQDDELNSLEIGDVVSVTITDRLPNATLVASVDPNQIKEPGGAAEISIVISNLIEEDPITLTSLTDSQLGSLDGIGTCSVPQVVESGVDYECRYSSDFSGTAGMEISRQITGTAEDDELNSVPLADEVSVSIISTDTIFLDSFESK